MTNSISVVVNHSARAGNHTAMASARLRVAGQDGR
jgi:hypothetical protein